MFNNIVYYFRLNYNIENWKGIFKAIAKKFMNIEKTLMLRGKNENISNMVHDVLLKAANDVHKCTFECLKPQIDMIYNKIINYTCSKFLILTFLS